MSENFLINAAGITFDFTNLYGQGKVEQKDILNIDEKTRKAHLAVQNLCKTGYSNNNMQGEPNLFCQLPFINEGMPNTPASIVKLKQFSSSVRNNVNAVISFGTGGSYLGNQVLFNIGCQDYWNFGEDQERGGYPRLYFSGQNIDGCSSMFLLDEILRQAKEFLAKYGKLYKVMLMPISKSGSTLEPLACFMWFYEKLNDYKDLLSVEVVAVTAPKTQDKETLLYSLASKNNWQLFFVPEGVGGRFSVFSQAGLVTAAAIGLDIESFLAGAKDMAEACQSDDIFKNPAFLNAVLKYLAAEKYGRDIEVFMPYSSRLKSLSEWYVQLLAESLGKTCDRDGNKVYYGRTPLSAVGTTDMHAQTQQHQEGKLDKVVQFIKIENWSLNPLVKNVFPDEPSLDYLSGVKFDKIMNFALEANAQALTCNGRFNATFTLPELNLYYLGGLMYMLALSVVYEGELANVNAFNQPGVETYKKILKELLKNC